MDVPNNTVAMDLSRIATPLPRAAPSGLGWFSAILNPGDRLHVSRIIHDDLWATILHVLNADPCKA
jgi:hypothetical protein